MPFCSKKKVIRKMIIEGKVHEREIKINIERMTSTMDAISNEIIKKIPFARRISARIKIKFDGIM